MQPFSVWWQSSPHGATLQMIYPDLAELSFARLREVWQTHPDLWFAEQAHVRMVDQVYMRRGWSPYAQLDLQMDPLF